MPRFSPLLAAWATVPALFAAGDAVPGPAIHPAVSVFMDFDSMPVETSFRAMKKEIEGLLKSSGLKLDWRVSSENQVTGPSTAFVVVRFRGRCRLEAWPQPGEDDPPVGAQRLGFTHVANGHVLPFSEIECDQIRKSLAYIDPGATPAERQKAFGLAMGRVVAHELYHMLARTTAHAEEGMAKASQSLRDLASAPAIVFGDKDSQAIGQAFIAK
jgi:hypothetical protein